MITKRDAVEAPIPRDVWVSPDYGCVRVRLVTADRIYVTNTLKPAYSPVPLRPSLIWCGSGYGDYFMRRDWPVFTSTSTCVHRGDTTLTVPWTWHLGAIPIGAPVLWTKGKRSGRGVVTAASLDAAVVMDGKRTVQLTGDLLAELDLSRHTGRVLGALVAAKERWGSAVPQPCSVAWMGRTNGLDPSFAPKDGHWSLYAIDRDGRQIQWDLPEDVTIGATAAHWPSEVLADMSPAAHAWALWSLLVAIAADKTPP